MEKGDLAKVENWIQRSTGYTITTYTPQDPTVLPVFVGQFVVPVKTHQGVGGLPIDFEIPAKDIDEAYSLFSGCARKRLEEKKKEMLEQSRPSVVSGAGVDVNKIPFPGIIRP
jgi:hypothetical protein